MREFKFRAWDGEKFSDLYDHDEWGMLILKRGEVSGTTYDVQQYTGLKDKNGAEIYEGDILEIHEDKDNLREIKWINEWSRFDTATPHSLDEMPHDAESLEIIGNIYENPELLKS